jgi:hypothetical protein
LKRCSEAARFNRKVMYDLDFHVQLLFRIDYSVTSHPNIPQMIGVSPLTSDLPYLILDGGS